VEAPIERAGSSTPVGRDAGLRRLLSRAQVDSLLGYLRDFCGNPRWARGELNFRPLSPRKPTPKMSSSSARPRAQPRRAGFVHPGRDLGSGGSDRAPRWRPWAALAPGPVGAGPATRRSRESGTWSLASSSPGREPPRGFIPERGLDVAFRPAGSARGSGRGTIAFEPFVAPARSLRLGASGANEPSRFPPTAESSASYSTAS